ncbi:MAG: hypothetical protein ACPGQL_05325 [Thermoplasmatota archaeon]
MRYCLFDAPGPRLGLLRGNDYVLDVEAIDKRLAGTDLMTLAGDEDAQRRLDKVGRGQPPQGTLRRVDRARFLPPVNTGRVVLVGGVQRDFVPTNLVGAGGHLDAAPEGSEGGAGWATGVGAVIRHHVHDVGDDWMEHLLGFAPLHVSGDQVALGPWIVGTDEVRNPLDMAFSAFLDDEPVIRPAKALLDWQGELARANEARALRAGDVVALAAPGGDGQGHVRSALVYNGTVLARLEADVGVVAAPPPAAVAAAEPEA